MYVKIYLNIGGDKMENKIFLYDDKSLIVEEKLVDLESLIIIKLSY